MTSAGGIHHECINLIAAAQMSGIVLNRSDLRAAVAARQAHTHGNQLWMRIAQVLQHALEALHRRILGVQQTSGVRAGRTMSQVMIVKGATELIVANAAMGESSHAFTAR
jgi:hypothetical protein